MARKHEEALKVLDQVSNLPGKAFSAARVYSGPGEKDDAFRRLERAIELRAPTVDLTQ